MFLGDRARSCLRLLLLLTWLVLVADASAAASLGASSVAGVAAVAAADVLGVDAAAAAAVVAGAASDVACGNDAPAGCCLCLFSFELFCL